MGALETELEAERGARVRLENEKAASDAARADALAARDAASSSARDAETALAAKALAAEKRARAAEDDQLRAEEDAAAARAELDAARRELAEVLRASRREERERTRASSPNAEETTRESERESTEDGKHESHESPRENENLSSRFEEERFALASEIRALTRKLDAARAEAAESRDAKARAEAAAKTRDAETAAAAAAAAARSAAALEAEKDAAREAEARARDAETAVAELRAAAAAAAATNANANVVSEAESATGRAFDEEGVRSSERSRSHTNDTADSKRAFETSATGNTRGRVSSANPDGSAAVATTVRTLTLERDAYLERLNAKIRSSNETQDLLLREMDARDGELETLDARLASALAGNAALNEKLDAALAMARAERVRVERLAEMLEEQAAWTPREARESHATNAIEERANEARDRGTRDRQREHERDGDPNERTVAAREVSRDERSADGGAAAPATPARDAPELKKNAVAESPAAKLAAEILAGSELGRAYHPLLASIEARLLRLRNEKLPDARHLDSVA